MTDLPDVKLRALANFPVSVTGRTGINVVKINGRWYIDYDVSGIVQNANIPVEQVDEYWFTIWNEPSNSYVNVPFSLAATSGVSSLHGRTGALDIGDGLKFTGDTLEARLYGTYHFETVAAAVAGIIPGSVNAVFVGGVATAGDAPPAVYCRTVSEPSHDGKFNNGGWFELERHDGCYLEDFGASNALFGTSIILTFDNADAFNKAVAYCVAKQRPIIRALHVYNFLTAPDPIPVGIRIEGSTGHASSLLSGSTAFIRNFSQTSGQFFLVWDGSGIESNSSGGGMRGVSVYAWTGTSGGICITSTGSSDAFREGYMTFESIQIAGQSGGTFSVGMQVDGTALTTSGTQGLRDTRISNCWIATGTSWGMLLLNATHTMIESVQLSGCNMQISGLTSAQLDKTVDLKASNLGVTGTLNLDNVDASDITGAVSDLVVTANVIDTTFRGTVANHTTFDGTSRWALANANRTYIYDQNAFKQDAGYRYTVDGLLEQWGTAATTSGAATVTFPLAYNAIPLDYIAQLNETQAGASINVNAYGASATQMSIRSEDKTGFAVAVSFRWKALGIPAASV